MFRRFVKRFEYQDKKAGKVIYPRGWAGEVTADVAKEADKVKATLPEKTAKAEADAAGSLSGQ